MRHAFLIRGALGLMGAAAVALTLLPSATGAPSAGFRAASAASPVFLQHPAAASLATPGRRGPLALGTLPNSTLPVAPANNCSVETATPAPSCSTLAGVGACSTQCDSGGVCSAKSGAPGAANCSTVQRATGCSILQPALGVSYGLCTAFQATAGFTTRCSTLTVQKKQGCSAENPGGALNRCSAFGLDTSAGAIYCSVLAPGGTERSFCSTFRPGDKRCSVGFFDPNGVTSGGCSIQIGAKGVCTALKLAPAGSCSKITGGHCSVINGPGPGPTGRCAQ